MVEVLWSTLKPFSKLARCMTASRWHDGFNFVLELLTRNKQRGFVELLESKIKNNQRKLGEAHWSATNFEQ